MNILKRIAITALCLILAGCGTAAADGGTGELKRITTPEEAEVFIRIFLGEDPARLDGVYMLSRDMDEAVAAAGGFGGLAGQTAALGTPTEIQPVYETAAGTARIYRVPCRFPMMPLDAVLAVDSDGTVTGLTFQTFTGSEADEPNDDQPYTETDLALPVPELNGELPGTLTMPEGDGPFPAVVLIHGSGPNDRDESMYGIKPFRDIAEALAKRGIAVFRFDKRTYVYPDKYASDRKATLMDESVLDAAEAVQLLAKQDKIDGGRIFVLGHSLGGTAIPAIDRELKERPLQARGYIMMAPGARRLDALVKEQYEFLTELMPELEPEREIIFADLKKLDNPDALQESDVIAGAYAGYWKWLMDYDAVSAAGEITAPCLLLQGEEDYQVTMEDFNLFRNAMDGKENWEFKSYPGLIHLFTEGKKDEGPAAYQRNGRVSGQVTDDIAEFILTQ